MEQRSLRIIGFLATAAIAAIGGAILWPALRGPSEQERQLAESNRVLVAEHDSLKSDLSKAVADQERHRAKMEALEVELETARGELQRNAELQGRLDAIQAERDAAQRGLTETADRTMQLEQRVSDMERSLTAATVEAESLRQQLSAERGEAETVGAELPPLQTRVQALEEEVQSQRQVHEAVLADRDQLRAELDAREHALEATQSEVAVLRQRYASLEQQNRTLTGEIESLAKQLAELEAKAATTAAEQEELSTKLAETGRTLEEAKSRAAELNKAYEVLLREKSELLAMDEARRAEVENTKKAFEDAQAEVARLTGARGIYTVQRTDSLSKIAAFFYHNGYRWPDIFAANAFLISHPDLIYPGMVLIIPR